MTSTEITLPSPDILLRWHGGEWVEIINNGTNGRSVPVAKFLQAHNQHFARVLFGAGPMQSSYGIKRDRVHRFIAYAKRHKLTAAFNSLYFPADLSN